MATCQCCSTCASSRPYHSAIRAATLRLRYCRGCGCLEGRLEIGERQQVRGLRPHIAHDAGGGLGLEEGLHLGGRGVRALREGSESGRESGKLLCALLVR